MAPMAHLAGLASDKRTALLCFERDACGCHRTLLRAAALPEFIAIDLVP
jgi:uncharacterized protein (DUF488 family)